MAESQCRGIWVDMVMDDPCFLELPSSDQRAATVLVLMALARTLSKTTLQCWDHTIRRYLGKGGTSGG